MPALSAFGRHWNIGSDDFVFPGCMMLFIRSTWLIVIVAVYSSHGNHHIINTCHEATALKAFYVGMIALSLIKIVINIMLIYYSSRGAIKDHSARRPVAKFLYMKLILFILEVGWLVLGAYWSTSDYSNCDIIIVNTVRVVVGFSWFGVIIFIIMIAFLFSPLGNLHTTDTDYSNTWNRRCRVICCNFRRPDENTADAYRDIADVVSEYFKDVDLVPTDVAAALLLLGREHGRLTEVEITPPSGVVRQLSSDRHRAYEITHSNRHFEGIKPWMTIYKASRIMKYALATYGWPLYAWSHMPCGCCSLCCSSPTIKLEKEQIYGDDCCNCHLITIEREIEDTRSEVFYASFTNELYVIPFVIFKDHAEKAVVVALRGTLSLRDAIIDMSALGDELGGSYPKSYKGHKGMLRSARNLVDRLVTSGLLDKAYSDGCESYGLVICGHSLGAGVAALLAMLLKPLYPELHCYAFAPPGGLLSEEACKASKEHTFSVVYGDDLVPRLSIQTMQELKCSVLSVIECNKHPKYKVFWSAPFRALSCKHCLLDRDDEEELINPNGIYRIPSYTVEQEPANQHEEQMNNAIECRDILRLQTPFYPPGCIMYITSTRPLTERLCCTNDSDYTWRWADKSEFLTLKVSPKMVSDHMPNVLRDVLDHLVPNNPQYPEEVISQTHIERL